MYGLVNKAIEGLVKAEFGNDTWEKIKKKADYHDESFISMTSYDDKITYNLVGAASEITNIPAADLLKAFGNYWVKYTAIEGYGDMLNMAGDNFKDFLSNLNNLHQRVGNMMPNLIPPFFEVQEITENELLLTYKSKREGLVPMVVGLIEGLAEKFNIKNLEITQQNSSLLVDSHVTVFNLKWKKA